MERVSDVVINVTVTVYMIDITGLAFIYRYYVMELVSVDVISVTVYMIVITRVLHVRTVGYVHYAVSVPLRTFSIMIPMGQIFFYFELPLSSCFFFSLIVGYDGIQVGQK